MLSVALSGARRLQANPRGSPAEGPGARLGRAERRGGELKDAMRHLRLGVNIAHVATVRNARGGAHPAPLRAALIARDAGADGIPHHLREERRHTRDAALEPPAPGGGRPLTLN